MLIKCINFSALVLVHSQFIAWCPGINKFS